MKRTVSLSLALLPVLAAPALIAVAVSPAQAQGQAQGQAPYQNCTQLWRSANAAQWTCSSSESTFQFQTVVTCKRPGLPNFSYTETGPYRASGGKSAAYCDHHDDDYRVDDSTRGIA